MIHQAVLWLFASLLISSVAFAQDGKLIEAAKKEGGTIVAYGSMETRQAQPIIDEFQKKTGLKAEYWRASATKVMDRALTELRAGKALFDVMVNNSGAINVLHKEGVFAKYDSPMARNFPKEVVDPKFGVSYRHTPIGIIFNSSLIKPADAPRSLEDLLNAKYRGKLVMPDPTQHTTTLQWLASLYKIMGKEKSEQFIRDLGASKPILVASLAPAAERVMSGETPIAVSLVRYVATGAEKGAPVDYVRLGKFLSLGQYLGLSHKAPHPNGGKALIDFFLGDESMQILAKAGEFVTRKGIPHPVPDADKIQAVYMDDFDASEFKAKGQELKKIFLK